MNEPRPSVDCATAIQALQEWLDGSPRDDNAELQVHLQGCDECRERFAAGRELRRAFPPRLRTDFAELMVMQVRADHRQRQWKNYCIAAGSLAATILVGVWFSWPMAQPKTIEIAKLTPTPTPSLDRQMARATSAVRDWTGRTTKALPRPDLTYANVMPASDLSVALEPVTSPLAEAGKGVADGLEPLAVSAKRAASRFWRDLPTVE